MLAMLLMLPWTVRCWGYYCLGLTRATQLDYRANMFSGDRGQYNWATLGWLFEDGQGDPIDDIKNYMQTDEGFRITNGWADSRVFLSVHECSGNMFEGGNDCGHSCAGEEHADDYLFRLECLSIL